MTKAIILTDLDDTIFASAHHFPPEQHEHLHLSAHEGRLSPSYMCDRRKAILSWLENGGTVIPATARELSGYNDVALPFHDGAIVANGAIILNPDNTEDQVWRDKMESILLEARHALEAVEDALKTFDKTNTLFQIDYYHCGDHAYGMTAKVLNQKVDQQEIEETLAAQLAENGLFDHVRPSWVNEYLGFMPNGVGKAPAVEYLLKTRPDLQNRPTIGMGDAPTDLEFMALCDLLVIPKNSKNAQKLLS